MSAFRTEIQRKDCFRLKAATGGSGEANGERFGKIVPWVSVSPEAEHSPSGASSGQSGPLNFPDADLNIAQFEETLSPDRTIKT